MSKLTVIPIRFFKRFWMTKSILEMSSSYTQKGVLKLPLRSDKLMIVGQRGSSEKFDKGEESLFLLYHMTSSYHNFLKVSRLISYQPNTIFLSVTSPYRTRSVSTGITIVSQDIAERLLENPNIISSSKKLKDIFIKTYAIVKMENKHYQDLLTIIQKLKIVRGKLSIANPVFTVNGIIKN